MSYNTYLVKSSAYASSRIASERDRDKTCREFDPRNWITCSLPSTTFEHFLYRLYKGKHARLKILQQLSMNIVNSLTPLTIHLENWLFIQRCYVQKQRWKFAPLFDIDY